MDQISLSRTNFIGALLIYLQTYASLPLIYSKCGISGIIKDRVAKHRDIDGQIGRIYGGKNGIN